MVEATCGCGNSWELRKDPTDYKDGPRCPSCGERNDVEISEPPDEETATEAGVVFEALADGADLTAIVTEHGVEPERVEALAESFERLSEYHVLTSGELAEIREDEREKVREQAERRLEQIRSRATEQVAEAEQEATQLHQQLQQARLQAKRDYESGFEAGVERGRQKGYEAAEAEFSDRLAELEEQIEERVAVIEAEAEARVQEAHQEARDLRDELEQAKAERVWLADALRRYKTGDEAEIYALGHADGVAVGLAEGYDEGRGEGMLETARALAPSH